MINIIYVKINHCKKERQILDNFKLKNNINTDTKAILKIINNYNDQNIELNNLKKEFISYKISKKI